MSQTVIEVGQAIGGYAALVAAVIAAIMVYITRQLRPLKMRSIELHSEQLKETIRQWLSEMGDPDGPSKAAPIPSTRSYIEEIPEPAPYALTLEQDILFRDLHNHLPDLMLHKWPNYKRDRDAYVRAKQHLTQSVLRHITSATGVRMHDSSHNLPAEDLLLERALIFFFDDLNEIAEGRSPKWFDLRLSAPELRFEGKFLRREQYAIVQSLSEQRGREIYSSLCQSLSFFGEKSSLIEDMRQHRLQFDSLCHMHQDLVAELQEWMKVPILPRECKLLKKAKW